MMHDPEKPLSEISTFPVDRLEIALGEDRRIVLDVTRGASLDVAIANDASFTIIGVGDVQSDVSFLRSITLGKNARVQLLLACRIASGVTLRCDDIVRVVQDGAECVIDDRCVIDGDGRAIVRQHVVVEKEIHHAKVSTSIRSMLLGRGRVRAIPELDIASNAVQAKHAVAIARPSASSIAYFASRGIDRAEAERALADQMLCPISTLV